MVATLNELQISTDGAIADSKIAYRFNGIGALRAEMIAAATKTREMLRYNLRQIQVVRLVQLATPHKVSFRSSPAAVTRTIRRNE